MTGWLRRVWFSLKALVGRRRMEDELREELDFHLSMETRKLVEEGMDPAAARREAAVRFGGVDRFAERTRDSWGVRWLQDLAADARYAARQLARRPGFTAVAVGTLALGIGGTTGIWAVVSGLMVRPLPYAHEDRLVTFWSEYNWRGAEYDHVSALELDAVEALAAYSQDGTVLRTDGGSTVLQTAVVSADVFDVLGASAALGRTFVRGEDRPGSGEVVVLSHGVWRQELGADPDVVGRRILLDGTPVTVVGVMPPDFFFPTPRDRIWRPLDLDPADGAYHGNGWLVLVGRTVRDASAEAVEGDVARMAAALGERFEYPEEWDKTRGAYHRPLRAYLLGDVRSTLLLLLGAVGLLLVGACANVGALLLARIRDRTAELAVRSSLGAGRGRLVRQVVAEGLVLGLLSGVTGAALAALLFDALVASLPLGTGMGELPAFDAGVGAAVTLLAVAVGVLVALPAIRTVGRRGVAASLARSRTEGGASGAGGRLQGGLVVAEVAVAVVLVAGATLLVRSVSRLQSVDPGFRTEDVVVADVFLGGRDGGERDRFFVRLADAAAALPGVRAAGLVNRLPVRDGGTQGPVTVPDRPDLAGAARPNAYHRTVTPETLEALGLEVVRGRGFTDADREDAPGVALVSESFARLAWPGDDPLGRTLRTGFSSDTVRVVGVVEDARIDGREAEAPRVVYRPVAQSGVRENNTLVLHGDADPAVVLPAVRALVRDLEPLAAVHRTGTMEQVMRASIARPAGLRFFLVLFGLLALGLGMAGVYGVVSYTVSRRTREIGVRLALGAATPEVVGGVLGRGVRPVALGVAVGLALSLGAGRLLAGVVYGVRPHDPLSLGAAALLLLAAGVAAATVPAVRASRVDPVTSLRSE